MVIYIFPSMTGDDWMTILSMEAPQKAAPWSRIFSRWSHDFASFLQSSMPWEASCGEQLVQSEVVGHMGHILNILRSTTYIYLLL